jgi:hypothetical protein
VTLNVASYGAAGNAMQVWVSSASNSAAVYFTNQLTSADKWKTIELFNVGNTNIGYSSLVPEVNNVGTITNCHQDFIGYITNVTTNVVVGTGGITNYIAWVWTPAGEVPMNTVTGAVYCIYGTNNANAFANCIAACPTNATVYIPRGTISPWGATNAYLLIPFDNYTNYNYTYYPYGLNNAPILLNRGGLTFLGDGEGQTILMAQGAFKMMLSAGNPNVCLRSGIFTVIGPITNDFPLVWTDLTFDGGVQNGLIGYQGIQPANPIDGLGWDGTDYAGLDQGPVPKFNSLEIFSNDEFRHMRGEMIKGISGAVGQYPGQKLVTNCFFWDGNATAFNYNLAHTICGCTFSNMYQIEEFYLAYPTDSPSYFINNFATNINHNLISLNGGTLTNEPYIISNNVFYCAIDGNDIATCPASHVLIASNLLISLPYTGSIIGDLGIVIGQAGAQTIIPDSPYNGIYQTDITVINNVFSNQFYTYFEVGAGTTNMNDSDVENIASGVLFSNNVIVGATGNRPLLTASVSTNVICANNNCFGEGMSVSSGLYGAPYPFVSTNNNYWQSILDNGEFGNPNIISYGGGSRYNVTYPYTPSVTNYLTVADSNQIPVGASILFTNTTGTLPGGGASGPVTVYLDGPNYSGPSATVPSGGTAVVYWSTNTWQWTTNSP